MKRLLSLAIFMTLSLSLPLHAADEAQYEEAMTAATSGQYDLAYDLFHIIDQQGDPRGAHNIGVIYEQGLGVSSNLQEAASWYQSAADRGVADAQYNIALMLEEGRGLQQNVPEAATYYQKAAEQGLVTAQFNLALLFQNGLGVEKDLEKAIAYYAQASEQGNADASYNLAIIYDQSTDMANQEKAIDWYKEAVRQGHAEARYNLAVCYYKGRGIAADSIAAFAWFSLAAEAGIERAEEALSGLTEELTAEQIEEARQQATSLITQ